MPTWAIDLDGDEPSWTKDPEGYKVPALCVPSHPQIQYTLEKHYARILEPNASDFKIGLEAGFQTIFGHPLITTPLKILLSPQNLYEYTNRNTNQSDPKNRAENSEKAKGALTDLLMMWGTSKLFSVVGSGFSGLTGIVRERFALAKSFYEEEGFAPDNTLDHISGIDLSKPVFERVYPKGTVLEQWKRVNAQTGEIIPAVIIHCQVRIQTNSG